MKSIFLKSGFAEEGLSKRLACQLFVDEQWEKSVVSDFFGCACFMFFGMLNVL